MTATNKDSFETMRHLVENETMLVGPCVRICSDFYVEGGTSPRPYIVLAFSQMMAENSGAFTCGKKS
jgi:hypothetical protein